MSTLTVRIPEPLRRELDKLCRAEKLVLSDVVRDSIKRYIASERFRALRRRTLPFAEAEGFLTDEDIFKAVS